MLESMKLGATRKEEILMELQRRDWQRAECCKRERKRAINKVASERLSTATQFNKRKTEAMAKQRQKVEI